MRLCDLMTTNNDITLAVVSGPDRDITGLTADSRAVGPGFLFAALPGSRHDGRAFIADAAARGASAVLAPQGTVLPSGAESLTLIEDPAPRRRFALLAAVAGVFYGMAFRTGKGIRAAMVTHALTVTTWKTFFS
mgnify:CR=1 FL=1